MTKNVYHFVHKAFNWTKNKIKFLKVLPYFAKKPFFTRHLIGQKIKNQEKSKKIKKLTIIFTRRLIGQKII